MIWPAIPRPGQSTKALTGSSPITPLGRGCAPSTPGTPLVETEGVPQLGVVPTLTKFMIRSSALEGIGPNQRGVTSFFGSTVTMVMPPEFTMKLEPRLQQLIL